jgi:hypothetical protein
MHLSILGCGINDKTISMGDYPKEHVLDDRQEWFQKCQQLQKQLQQQRQQHGNSNTTTTTTTNTNSPLVNIPCKKGSKDAPIYSWMWRQRRDYFNEGLSKEHVLDDRQGGV